MITGRLIGIRPMEMNDLPRMTMLANDPRVRAMVVGWDWMVSPSQQEEWLLRSSQQPNTRRLTVVNKLTGDPIGLTGLWDIDWHNRSALSAIKLLPNNGLRGAGSDTIMLVNAWAFREVGLHRLYGAILPFNVPSLKAYIDRCGWVLEGRERQSVFRNGQWHDLIRVAMLDSDFERHPDASEYASYIFPAGTTDVEPTNDLLRG